MIWAAVAALTCVALGAAWRRSFLRERPLALWGRSWSGPSACVEELARVSGLAVERLPDGWEWLVDLLLSPVWFFWGDLRTRRPARQLRRWRLVGSRDDRLARVTFGDDALTLSLDVRCVALWAEPPAIRPLADQEGTRPLQPVGAAGWQSGSALLERAFALGAIKVVSDSVSIAANARPAQALPPERWPELFATLAALATLLGSAVRVSGSG